VPTSAPARRLIAAATAVGLALLGSLAVAAPASAEEVAFTIDDFAGHSMGTRTVVQPDEYSCDLYDNATAVESNSTLRIAIPGTDSRGCTYPVTQVRWTASSSADLTSGGADRIQLKYRGITPAIPGAITFGITAVDTNGRTATVGGLSRNGGDGTDFLTIRYVKAYEGDVSYLHQQAGFDLTHVRTVTLTVAGTQGTATSVTFESLGFSAGEPTYVAPSIEGPDTQVFPVGTSTSRTFSVSGFPEPDVTVTGLPSGFGVTTTKGDGKTSVTIAGTATSAQRGYTTVHVHATVANSLTADRDVRVLVPTLVTFTPRSDVTTTVGEDRTVALGTVSSAPDASASGTTGLPPGTALRLTDGTLSLTGAPTTDGLYTVSTTLGNGYESTHVDVAVTVRSAPTIADVDDLALPVGVPMTPVVVPLTGYPAPTLQSPVLPDGITATIVGGAVHLSGTPTSSGLVHASITVQNSVSSASTTFDVRVGTPASLDAVAPSRLVAGTPATVPLVTHGDPTATVSSDDLPAGLSLSSADGAVSITGTPARSAAGTGTSTLHVTNALGDGTPVTWSWTVDAAPRIAGPTTVGATVGAPVTATFSTDGHPEPSITATASDLHGLTLDHSQPGRVVLAGTPTTTGTFTLHLESSNGVGPGVTDDVTVTVRTAPTFASSASSLTFVAGELGSHVITAAGYETPTLSLTGTRPAWLMFDPSTGRFSGVPTRSDAGHDTTLTLTATNAAGAASTAVTIHVVSVPVLSLSSTGESRVSGAASVDTTIGTVTGFPAPDVTADDLPDGLTLEVDEDGALVLTGSTSAAGQDVDVTIHASNGVGPSVTATLPLQVREAPSLSGAGTYRVHVGAPADLQLPVRGYPAPTVTGATGLPAGLTVDAGGHVAGTPAATGTVTGEISLVNAAGTKDVPVTFEVVDGPAFAVPPATTQVLLGDDVDLPVFTVSGYPAPELHATGLPDGLRLVAAGSAYELVGTPTRAGRTTVHLVLGNGVGDDATREWSVEVQEPAAVQPVADITADLGTELTPVALAVSGYPRPVVSATGLPAGLSVLDDGTQVTLVGTPTQDGTFHAVVTARNGVGDDTTTTVDIDVRAGATFGDDTYAATFPAGQDSTLSLEVHGHHAPALTTEPLPGWLQFDAGTATFTGHPTAADAGPVPPVVVTATNATGTAHATVEITVSAPPAARDASGTTTVRAGRAIDQVLTTVTGFPVPTVEATGLPDGLTAQLVGAELHLVGTTTALGQHSATLTLANGAGPEVDVAWAVEVDAPAVATAPARVDGQVGTALTVPVSVAGYPAPTVTATGLPDGIVWTPGPGGGTLAGTPTQATTSSVVLTADNGLDSPSTVIVTLVVAPRPSPEQSPASSPSPSASRSPSATPSASATPSPAATAPADGVEVTLSLGSVRAGQDLTVEATGLGAGEGADIWLHSTPVLLTSAVADSTGALHVVARIPAATTPGTHTVIVRTAGGAVGRATIRVTAAGDLATTGAEVARTAGLAVLAVLAGAAALGWRRSRRAA